MVRVWGIRRADEADSYGGHSSVFASDVKHVMWCRACIGDSLGMLDYVARIQESKNCIDKVLSRQAFPNKYPL
jgi:hypothetical protein